MEPTETRPAYEGGILGNQDLLSPNHCSQLAPFGVELETRCCSWGPKTQDSGVAQPVASCVV